MDIGNFVHQVRRLSMMLHFEHSTCIEPCSIGHLLVYFYICLQIARTTGTFSIDSIRERFCKQPQHQDSSQ